MHASVWIAQRRRASLPKRFNRCFDAVLQVSKHVGDLKVGDKLEMKGPIVKLDYKV